MPRRICGLTLLVFAGFPILHILAQEPEWPANVGTVLSHTKPLENPRGNRLPLYVLPISNQLAALSPKRTKRALQALNARGIGYTVDWDPNHFEASLNEGLRIARLQRKLGMPVAVNANACLYSFFAGSESTLHVDAEGKRFADSSSGRPLGCPFTLESRVPIIQARMERFVEGYARAGQPIDFIFADWEIDGPIEWNDAWETCQQCVRCQSEMPELHTFSSFQQRMREIRSDLQRRTFATPVLRRFPQALVGNYGNYPHNGLRYWYDYFEREPPQELVVPDQGAPHRRWAHEFAGTGYTFAMPVVYTWYRTFDWYDFANPDYRWAYNMLQVGSNAGRHTSPGTPIIPFVHWHTTAPPQSPKPHVQQLSATAYQDVLWHLLLRGHDTFFVWCLTAELAEEVRLAHEVYAASLAYAGFLERGQPISFDVPSTPQDVVSGLRLGDQVLLHRARFADDPESTKRISLGEHEFVTAPAKEGISIVPVEDRPAPAGLIGSPRRPQFPLGFYDVPQDDAELKRMAQSGVNLVRCGNRASLDRAQAAGLQGWVPLPVHLGATPELKQQIQAVADHPALAVWEGPDEIIWTFTAYSFLQDRAGFSRDDWNAQKKIAVDYAEREAARIMPAIQEAVALVRQLDPHQRAFWINEAADSDAHYAREYMPSIDITGCDYYAVRSAGTDLQSVGRLVDRWDAIGQGKPVWMVLQAFSWHALKPERGLLYPSFPQTRFMAYDAITHGARGILYWGAFAIDDEAFRDSLYAMTAELAALQDFLVRPAHEGVQAHIIDDLFDPPGIGVRTRLLAHDGDWLLILANEDNQRHLGVDVTGLTALEGRTLGLLYGEEQRHVRDGRFVTRMQPHEVKVFSTKPRAYETRQRTGRDYVSPDAPRKKDQP